MRAWFAAHYDLPIAVPNLFRHSWLLLVIGCASPMTALREDNHRLNTSVNELRSDRRAQDRKIRDLEHQLDLAKAAQPVDQPQLRVEVAAPSTPAASPSGERVVGIADDGSEIVYEGDAALGKAAPPPMIQITQPAPRPMVAVQSDDRGDRNDRIDVTHHARRSISTRSHEPAVAADGDPAGDYRAAVELVKSGKHDEAVAALRAFLVKYPRHDYADNAQYWLGESFYAQKDFPHALAEFRTVIETYPRGNKVPDALLKVGFCYQAMGQGEKAHAVLAQVVNLYPKSEPAALAAKRLETP